MTNCSKHLLTIAIMLIAFIWPGLSHANNYQLNHGFSILAPGTLNYVYRGKTFMVSFGGANSNTNGFEAGIRYLYREQRGFRSLNLIVGTSRTDNDCDRFCQKKYDEWKYYGFSSTFQWGKFFIEPSVTAGSGDYNSPQVLLQLGLLFW